MKASSSRPNVLVGGTSLTDGSANIRLHFLANQQSCHHTGTGFSRFREYEIKPSLIDFVKQRRRTIQQSLDIHSMKSTANPSHRSRQVDECAWL